MSLTFLISQFDRLHNDFTNLSANARDSCLTLHRGVDPLLDEFRASLDDEDVTEDLSVLSLNEQFPAAFNKLRY